MSSYSDFVLGVLVGQEQQSKSIVPTLESLERALEKPEAVEIVLNNGDVDYFSFLEMLRERHPDKHIIAMHSDIYFDRSFIRRLLSAISDLDLARRSWGVLGPAGINYPYFKLVRNIEDFHGILYPFALPMTAVHLDGHFLVINKNLKLGFEGKYHGFHHYDTLLCISSWEQGFPVYIINAPLKHLGRGNVEEWRSASTWLGEQLGLKYSNKSIATSMGPVVIKACEDSGTDFYRDVVDCALDEEFKERIAQPVFLFFRVREGIVEKCRKSLLSICSQFKKPDRVTVLCPSRFAEQIEPEILFFANFINLNFVVANDDKGLAEDIFLGAELPPDFLSDLGYTAFIDEGVILFPNYVRDISQFSNYCEGGNRTAVCLDFNLCDQDGEKLVSSGDRTEQIEDVISGNCKLPICSFAFPSRLIEVNNLEIRFSEKAYVLWLASLCRFYFIRRLGGVSPIEIVDRSPGEYAHLDLNVLKLTAPFPFGAIEQHGPQALTPPPQNTGLSKEQILARKLTQYPRLVALIFRVNMIFKSTAGVVMDLKRKIEKAT